MNATDEVLAHPLVKERLNRALDLYLTTGGLTIAEQIDMETGEYRLHFERYQGTDLVALIVEVRTGPEQEFAPIMRLDCEATLGLIFYPGTDMRVKHVKLELGEAA